MNSSSNSNMSNCWQMIAVVSYAKTVLLIGGAEGNRLNYGVDSVKPESRYCLKMI